MFLDLLIALVALGTGAAIFSKRLRFSTTWRAMITPLASIIGSGFLVLGPILDHGFGGFAPLVMAGLCLVAWGFGASIRHNIETIDATGAGSGTTTPEITASALLGFAFTISVAYYLNLFGAFALSLTPFATDLNARILTTLVYAVILFTGWTRGFAMLERMEYATVTLKLAIIAGLLVGLAAFNIDAIRLGEFHVGEPTVSGWGALTLTFGLIVTVQGFETSRYLGSEYDAVTRIRSMRWAQMLSSAIYLVYIALVAYVFAPDAMDLNETAIVDLMAIVSPILPALLVAAALAAQLSAAVADTGGSGGLIEELTHGRIGTRQAYVLTVAIGLALTWTSDVFQIIAYASRAFAAYYAVQAGIAAWSARANSPARALLFASLAFLGVMIALFGQSIE